MCRSFALQALRVLTALILLSAAVAHAAEHRFSLLLDTDDDAATGCVVASSAGNTSGIEQVITAVVATGPSTATVARIERQGCVGGVLGPVTTLPGGGYPVGLGNGTDGASVIELALARSLLPATGHTRVTVLGVNAQGGADLSPSFLLDESGTGTTVPVPVPPWLPALLLVLLAATAWRRIPRQMPLMLIVGVGLAQTLAWAATVILDGQTGDWAGVAPAVTSPHSGPANADIVAVFHQRDDTNLYLRIDADVGPDSASETGIRASAGADQSIVLPATASLAGSAMRTPPATFTYAWAQMSGPALASLADAASASTTATFTQPGTYQFQFTASADGDSASATTTVTVTDSGPSLAAIANRTIALGDSLDLALAGSSPNVAETLTYSLPTSPSGAALNPAPLVRWTPGAVGTYAFTARVTDSQNRSDSKSFSVTVVPQNRAPRLADQPDATLKQGGRLQRTLVATDPDGHAVTFELVSGPSGASLNGADLNWSSGPATPGSYPFTVKAKDPAGLFDLKRFMVEVSNVPPPLARDDSYEARAGDTLTVNAAAGVLKNDFSPDGSPLSAVKLTDPNQGSLTEFNADGSFKYDAPNSTPAYPSLTPKALWTSPINPAQNDNTNFGFAADINHDGAADLIGNNHGTPVAFDGKTGAVLWRGWDTSASSPGRLCQQYLGGTVVALGDVDDSGEITVVLGTACDAQGSNQLIALDANPAHAVNGAARVKWVSARLDEKLPLPPSVGAQPVPTHLSGGGVVPFATPTLARLTPSGGVKILTRYLIQSGTYQYDSDGDGQPDNYAACRVATGNPADEGKACKVTFIVDAATGVKEAALTAPNPRNDGSSAQWEPMRQTAPVVADLDGDGQVEIISGTEVFKLVSGQWTLAWQVADYGERLLYDPISVSVADLDGDGKAEVIVQAMWSQNFRPTTGFLIYRHDGTLLRAFSVPTSSVGMPTIADIDGDGTPEIVFAARGIVYAYRPDGTVLWANAVPDDDNDDDDANNWGFWPQPVANRSSAGTSVQIYDLDLDGVPEVIVNASYRLAIFGGRTGTLKTSVHNKASTASVTMPMVVDTDGDGHAEIASMPGASGVCGDCPAGMIQPFAGKDRDWAPAPLVHNQVSYNPWAIDDAGKISYDGAVRRSFRAQRQMGTVVDPRTRATASFTYKANDGAADSAAATVRVLVVPRNSPPVITSVPPTGAEKVNEAPVNRAIYTLSAYDPDPGDTVRYELVDAFDVNGGTVAVTVDPSSGAVQVPSNYQIRVFIIVAAIDSHGARTEQSFEVDISSQTSTVPNVVGQTLVAAKTSLGNASLRWRVASEVFAPQSAGTVIGQTPSASTVPRSTTVNLTVSKGPQPVAVPMLVDLAYTAADTKLTALGLTGAPTYVFSKTVPAGQVMAQNPSPGTLQVPLPANPVALTVSAGVGLALRLNHSVANAGQPITITPMAFSETGDPLPVPTLTYQVTPLQTPHLGSLPTVSGQTINVPANTLGAFRLTATDAANARSASVDFAVLLPAGGDGTTNGEAYASMFAALDAMEAFKQDLKDARAANDIPQMKALLGQIVTLWRDVDLGRVRTAMPLVTPDKFPPTVAMMQDWGHSATADDLLMQQVMRQSIDNLRAFTQGLRTHGTSYASLNGLADNFALDAARGNGLTISRYGGILNQREYTIFLSHELPVFYDTLMEVVAASIGMPSRDSPFAAKAMPGPASARVVLKSGPTLAELAVTQAVDMITDKIMEQEAAVYQNARKFAVDCGKQAAWTAAAVAITMELRDFVYGEDIYEVVSGASLSFRVFNGGLSFLEVPGGIDEPGLVSVMIIGPSTISEAGTAITDLFNKLKEGFSYGLDPATNPLRFKNLDDAKKRMDGLMTKLQDVGKAVTGLQDVIDNAYQRPSSVDRGCVFSPDITCSQLIYDNGFKPVYVYKPPPGFGSLGGLPVPIIFIVQNQLTGAMYFGTPIFLPVAEAVSP